jgi:hypothetical protein
MRIKWEDFMHAIHVDFSKSMHRLTDSWGNAKRHNNCCEKSQCEKGFKRTICFIKSDEGFEFNSAKSAADHYNVTVSSIYNSIRLKRPMRGGHQFFLGAPLWRGQKIKCVDTGIVYESIKAASKGCLIIEDTLQKAIKAGRYTVKGMKFEKVTE